MGEALVFLTVIQIFSSPEGLTVKNSATFPEPMTQARCERVLEGVIERFDPRVGYDIAPGVRFTGYVAKCGSK